MSENEGFEMEVEEQSEDGELSKSPHKHSPLPLSKDMATFGMSDEEADDTADSLDIKPPQAAVAHYHKSRSTGSSKRGKHSDRGTSGRREHMHSSKSESHRKGHHRSREHRERHEDHIREKHRHRERREHGKTSLDRDRVVERLERVVERGDRMLDRERLLERERERAERIDRGERGLDRGERVVDRGERVLEDLRERLLDKRRSENERRIKVERRDRERRIPEEEPVQPVAAPPKETQKERAERMEREMRRERLLEADREMARQKDVYRRELEARRERRHLEKEKEMLELAKKREQSPSLERKKRRVDNEEQLKEIEAESSLKNELSQQVVTVSDNSDNDEDSGAENNDTAQNEDNSQDGDDDEEEASSGGEEEDDDDEGEEEEEEDESESSSGTDEEEGAETGESVRITEEGKDGYTNHRSPRSRVNAEQPHSPVNSEVSESQKDANKAEKSEKTEKQTGENGIPFITDSPKAESTLQDSLPPYLPAIQGCRSVEEFQCLNRIEEGTYGVVYRARDKRTQEVVALKRLKMEKEKEGFPITSLREINTLLKAQHPNIVTVREIVVGSNMDKIFIVMDYVEHDLKSLMETMKQKKQCFIPGEIKCLMLQLLRAVAHLHDNWILHRDLKTSNLLLSHKGILKVGDFGLAREYGSPLKGYTPIVVTLWYRAPELLLCTKEYSTPIDMWSVGCIFGEFLMMEALFPGKSEVDQLNRIFKDLGTPNEKIWPGYSKLPAVQKFSFTDYPINQLRRRFGAMITDVGMDLMNRFLTFDPVQRVTAEDALRHPYFEEAPLPIDPAMFPTWPAKSEGHRKAAAPSPKPPPGGHEYKQLGDDEEVPTGGFHMGVTEQGRIAVGAGFYLKY